MKYPFVLLILILFQSCDCVQHYVGTVVDQNSKEPISGVEIYREGRPELITLSKNNGEFEITLISGGLFGCPRVELIYKKEGYEDIRKKGGGEIEMIQTATGL